MATGHTLSSPWITPTHIHLSTHAVRKNVEYYRFGRKRCKCCVVDKTLFNPDRGVSREAWHKMTDVTWHLLSSVKHKQGVWFPAGGKSSAGGWDWTSCWQSRALGMEADKGFWLIGLARHPLGLGPSAVSECFSRILRVSFGFRALFWWCQKFPKGEC